ncbi:hypothetical protein BJV82DRAFT_295686 [Fennellomyces sp. T-0311]|nr:hypothetical protein BJV82DRAFT_295686 [Fennellomyces sp. T-0311]
MTNSQPITWRGRMTNWRMMKNMEVMMMRIPQDWSRGFAPFPQTSMLHRTQSHVSEDEDEDQEKKSDLYKDNKKQPKEDDDDDDPFGDFTSSENDNQDWTQGFTSSFESIQISQDGNNKTAAPESDPKQTMTHDYVRAVKTKEEQDAKLAKDYRSEEEQQGEI